MIKSFRESIFNGKITINEADKKKSNLLQNIVEFNIRAKPKAKTVKKKKSDSFKSINALYEGYELTLNAFKSGIFPLRPTQRKGIKILISTHLPRRLQIALAQLKAGKTSKYIR